jgi:hypothetical protein
MTKQLALMRFFEGFCDDSRGVGHTIFSSSLFSFFFIFFHIEYSISQHLMFVLSALKI